MCDLCGHGICDSRCPNYNPPTVYTCDRCGGAIYDGDRYYMIDDIDVKTLILCDECISDCKRYAEFEPYEKDEMDVWKEHEERRMIEEES